MRGRKKICCLYFIPTILDLRKTFDTLVGILWNKILDLRKTFDTLVGIFGRVCYLGWYTLEQNTKQPIHYNTLTRDVKK